MSESKKKITAKPIKTVRHGAVAASIWKRQAPSGFEYFDFSLSRSWKTQSSGREGYSPNFFSANADDLHKVISEATSGIASQQASMLADKPDEQSSSTFAGPKSNGDHAVTGRMQRDHLWAAWWSIWDLTRKQPPF